MSTNYYQRQPKCECCGRSDPDLHIGLSSYGWTFQLHVIPELGLNSLLDWKAQFEKGEIYDEYCRPLTPKTMFEVIVERAYLLPNKTRDLLWLNANYAQEGPNGLARSKISDRCIGHGDGPWDLIIGNFS